MAQNFELEEDTGVMRTSRTIMWGNLQSINFVITASDSGSPSLQSEPALVSVTIVPANRRTPTFDESRYEIDLTDSDTRGRIVHKFVATDGDGGNAGWMTFSLPRRHDRVYFSIEPDTGIMRVVRLFDRRTNRNGVRVVVKVEDNADAPEKRRSSTSIAHIEVSGSLAGSRLDRVNGIHLPVRTNQGLSGDVKFVLNTPSSPRTAGGLFAF